MSDSQGVSSSICDAPIPLRATEQLGTATQFVKPLHVQLTPTNASPYSTKYTLNYLDGIGFGLSPRSALDDMTRCPARGDGIESGFPGAVNPRLRACPLTRSDFRRVELSDKRQGKSRGSCRRERRCLKPPPQAAGSVVASAPPQVYKAF